jgi:hypothetical protein
MEKPNASDNRKPYMLASTKDASKSLHSYASKRIANAVPSTKNVLK